MAKYLFKVSYSTEGAQGLLKEGGSKRREAVTKLAKEMGGTIEAFYFAFGDSDAVVIADFPDASTVAALSLAVARSGAARLTTVPLLTPEEIDSAAKKTVAYRAPGH